MAHSIGGYTIYVTADDQVGKSIIAELNVLDSTASTIQHFSKPSVRRRIVAYVITKAKMDSIRALSSGSTAVNYTSDQGSQGNFYLANVNDKRLKGRPMGFDGASPTDPIYLATMDLIDI
jgi:hypothetical protein